MKRPFCAALLCLALAPRPTEAQLLPGFNFDSRQFTIEQLSETHVRLTGEVEIDGGTWGFYADQVDLFSDDSRLVAYGNVVYTAEGSRVAAERVEFNTETLTGTFYNAFGSIVLGEDVERSMFGSQEPDMYFYGESIEKLGPRSYRLTKGGFTSCIQPTPRWQMTASTVTLNLDNYALLRNSVLEVKGVPVFYLPIMYYPIQEDGRATGLLIPTYGASTFRGQSLSNAFFWAINRSHDATLFHDWFTQTGQGMGAEYRYVLGSGSQGNARTYFLNERETTVTQGGAETSMPARRSFEVRANARHVISPNLTARGQVDFFSDITVQQTYSNNIFEASSRERNMSGNVAGSWGLYQLSGTFDVNETFFGDQESTLWGGGPRVTFGQGQRSLPGTPLYFSFGSEYVRLLRTSVRDFGPDEVRLDSGLHRFDVTPVLADPVFALAVLHRQLVGVLAGYVLERERRSDHHAAGANQRFAYVRGPAVADHRAQLRQGVGHAQQRLRGADETRDRALRLVAAGVSYRRIRPYRSARERRFRRGRRDSGSLRHQQPYLCQTVGR